MGAGILGLRPLCMERCHHAAPPHHGQSLRRKCGVVHGWSIPFQPQPIYLGDWFVLLGSSLIMSSAWPVMFAPAIWLIIRDGVIRHEEAYLESRFGDTYRAYRNQVRRWDADGSKADQQQTSGNLKDSSAVPTFTFINSPCISVGRTGKY